MNAKKNYFIFVSRWYFQFHLFICVINNKKKTMIFTFFALWAIFFTILYFLKSSKVAELKNDFKASFPAIVSNIEDIIFSGRNKVGEF